MKKEPLFTIDGETLADIYLPPTKFAVQSLLPQGVAILGGAPKVGKSWLVLDLCIRIAKGESIWNLPTEKGSTLYLCLEDTLRRIQERLNIITDEIPDNVFFATEAKTLEGGLCQQIMAFVYEHPDTRLVVIDTFQLVRKDVTDISYGNDYQEIQEFKKLADKLGISLLLVHHLRKQGDSDPLNKLSGSTGISGAVDAVFVLERSKRSSEHATLLCTGRDIPYREIELQFEKDSCAWSLIADSMEKPELLLPKEMIAVIGYMQSAHSFSGSNKDFAECVSIFSSLELSAKGLKQMMNRNRYELEKHGVSFDSKRSNGQRLLTVTYSDASAASDENTMAGKTCVPCAPCVPVEAEVGDLCRPFSAREDVSA